MNALYFRHLFQNTARGVVHTVSASGEKGEFCLCSLCSDGKPLEKEAHAGELFRLEKAVIRKEGNYLFFCVAADKDKVESEIDALLK